MKRNLGLALIAIFVVVLTFLLLPTSMAKRNESSVKHSNPKNAPIVPDLFKVNRQEEGSAAPVAMRAVNFAESIPVPATYYVAVTGSDSNPGTQASPFKTIQKAANVVVAGDTVLVADGTYTGANSCSGETVTVCLSRGGTASAKVSFIAQNKWGAKIDGQGTSNVGFYFQASVSYVHIEGFEIFNFKAPGSTSGDASGITIYNGGDHSEIVRNNIHDIGKQCTSTSNGLTGIFVQQPNVTIDKNLIHDIGRYLNGENGCSTTYQASRDHGIYVDGNTPSASGATIQNNIFYNCKRGWSIQLYPGSLTGILIANNTFSGENPYQVGHIIVGANLTGAQIVNNIFYDPNTAAIYFYSGTQTNMVVSNNITCGGTISTGTATGVTFTGNINSLLGHRRAPPAPGSHFGVKQRVCALLLRKPAHQLPLLELSWESQSQGLVMFRAAITSINSGMALWDSCL